MLLPPRQIQVGGTWIASYPQRNQRKQSLSSKNEAVKEVKTLLHLDDPVLSLPTPYSVEFVQPILDDETVDTNTAFQFEDHPTDVITHGWSPTLMGMIAELGLSLTAYMVHHENIEIKNAIIIEVEGRDVKSLIWNFLTECLSVYGMHYFLVKKIKILDWIHSSGQEIEKFQSDTQSDTLQTQAEPSSYSLRTLLLGEKYDVKRHQQNGAEVKAITMHQISIQTPSENADQLYHGFVLLDI